jgi:hypothetical protein
MHPYLTTLVGLALGASLGALANPASADDSISTGFVFEMLGLKHCEILPDDVPAQAIEQSLAESAAAGLIPLNAAMAGFMSGDRMGMTLFGTRAEETSLTTVSSIWGPIEGLGYRTLCLAMIQLGDQPVVPGTFRIVGSQGMATANSGDVLAVATIACPR